MDPFFSSREAGPPIWNFPASPSDQGPVRHRWKDMTCRYLPFFAVMDYARRFVGGIDFSAYAQAVTALEGCHAFGKPADAMGGGGRLGLQDS